MYVYEVVSHDVYSSETIGIYYSEEDAKRVKKHIETNLYLFKQGVSIKKHKMYLTFNEWNRTLRDSNNIH